ncbi:hypothetical protein K466DRAFT_345635 [Polyporus arcularius HHB13444]|uniref:Uncharacterized protein n=1 Tax=Polyporus arcularius HHB13444 TaxID=1314778 RepID=A0A5C3PP36_9APHY|nr:hypothetical protein K466DRAFT_345635 [Polyporus arcularius HHB13444]
MSARSHTRPTSTRNRVNLSSLIHAGHCLLADSNSFVYSLKSRSPMCLLDLPRTAQPCDHMHCAVPSVTNGNYSNFERSRAMIEIDEAAALTSSIPARSISLPSRPPCRAVRVHIDNSAWFMCACVRPSYPPDPSSIIRDRGTAISERNERVCRRVLVIKVLGYVACVFLLASVVEIDRPRRPSRRL